MVRLFILKFSCNIFQTIIFFGCRRTLFNWHNYQRFCSSSILLHWKTMKINPLLSLFLMIYLKKYIFDNFVMDLRINVNRKRIISIRGDIWSRKVLMCSKGYHIRDLFYLLKCQLFIYRWNIIVYPIEFNFSSYHILIGHQQIQ